MEHDEVKLLTELGHDVFSIGAYSNGGEGHYLLPRPSIPGMKYYPDLEKIARENPRTNLPKSFFDQFDIIIDMHTPEFITENWEKMKNKKVVWRSIGQSTKHVENMIRRERYDGLKIVRYSPMEAFLPDYLGADTTIRFYKDSKEFSGWTGNERRAINFTQSLKGRRVFCHYDDIMLLLEGFPAIIYGSGNDDLGPLNGGDLPFDLMKGALRDNRVFVYAGTWPAPYTLTFIEAMMTGIPMVCIGPKLAEEINEIAQQDRIKFYEIGNIIKNGENGFIADSIPELRANIHLLLEDHELAKKISEAGRKTAVQIFDKEPIKEQWKEFLDSLI